MITRVPSSTSGLTSVSLAMVMWSGLLVQDSLSSPMDPFQSNFGSENIEERDAHKSAA